MRRPSFISWPIILSCWCFLLAPTVTLALDPGHLVSERASQPLGITAEHPRLGWLNINPIATDRGQRQTAYQALVASSFKSLADDKGDLWDSGKVSSDQSIDVPYGGRALHSGQQCFWKVKVWDRNDEPSQWSSPASWSVGVLDAKEWAGKWIGVGDPSAHWTDYTIDANFTIEKEAAAICFRAKDAGDAYMWQINITGSIPTFRPHIRIAGAYQEIKRVPIDRWLNAGNLHSPHRMTIQIRGSEITTTLDGHAINVMTDSQYTQGSIGFRSSVTEQATFQNILVTDPSGRTLFKQDFITSQTGGFRGGTSGPTGLAVNNSDVMLDNTLRTPRLRHEFNLNGPIVRAWVYASALGIYQLRLNGQAVGDQYFAPGWTNYRKRIEYQTYDVTSLLKQGNNAIAAQAAPGWFAGNIGWFGPNQYGPEPRLFAELHIEYADGKTEIVASDQNWKASAGPIVSADYLDGEMYDARLEQPGWDQSGFDDHDWKAVDVSGSDENTRLVSQIDPPIHITREWKPVEVTEAKPGVYIYALPQNITGVSRVKLTGSPGTVVTIRHAEALHKDGSLNLITLDSPGIGNARAHNIDTFIFGKETTATFQPQFSWRGFQYIQISGTTVRPTVDDVTGLSIGTDVPVIGDLHTSDELINQIYHNMFWSGRDAFMSFPMDCPQRSERLGWAGDANFYLSTATYNFDMSRFYSKWEQDLIDSQSPGGLLCHVAPGGWAGESSGGGYGGGWGDVAICVPYQLWKAYGDLQPIHDHYLAMAKWIAYLQHLKPDLILPAGMAAAGDWQNRSDPTPQELCATAYFAYDTRLMSEMADAIQQPEDAKKYRNLFNQIRSAFISKFVASDGKVGAGSQTGYVLALHIGLIPDDQRPAVIKHLVDNITRHGNHLTTGFVGTQWLLPVLTDISREDLAYAILQQTDRPSWGYMVKHGATTIWENWAVISDNGNINPGPNSLNHCALGSCGDWLYENIGGISRDPHSDAFRKIIIHPRPGGGVTSAEARCESPYGMITTQWRLEQGQFKLEVTIPVGSTARIILPADSQADITESGLPADRANGVHLERFIDTTGEFSVGSGVYSFVSKTP